MRALLQTRHPGAGVARRGEVHDVAALPGFLAEDDAGEPLGVATYRIGRAEAELVSLDAFRPGCGAGAALVERVVAEADGWGCGRVWAAVPNDRLATVDFLQRRGWDLVALHHGALLPPRRHPSQPAVGDHGVPVRHELEIERRL